MLALVLSEAVLSEGVLVNMDRDYRVNRFEC
jgi:hypothetical protein